MMDLTVILRLVKNWLGDFRIEIDRPKQIIRIIKPEETIELTVDQLLTVIEKFNEL